MIAMMAVSRTPPAAVAPERTSDPLCAAQTDAATSAQSVESVNAARSGRGRRTSTSVPIAPPWADRPLTASGLASAVRLSSAATTELVDQLERACQVERQRATGEVASPPA